jgi:hypothetical protein
LGMSATNSWTLTSETANELSLHFSDTVNSVLAAATVFAPACALACKIQARGTILGGAVQSHATAEPNCRADGAIRRGCTEDFGETIPARTQGVEHAKRTQLRSDELA